MKNKQLDRIEGLLSQLVGRLPPADSPFVDNLLCHKRKPDIPCKCQWWQEIVQEGKKDSETGFVIEPTQIVKGCAIDLNHFMINGAIRTNNQAAGEASGIRLDVQQLRESVANHQTTVEHAIATGLAVQKIAPSKDIIAINGRRGVLGELTEGDGT